MGLRGPKRDMDLEKEVCLCYGQGNTLRQCAKLFDYSFEGIRRILKRNKQKIRPPHKANKVKK